MDRNKSNKGKRTKKDKISELKNITQNAGLDFVFDPIIDEYFSYEKTFSAYGLLVYIMGSERLKLIRKWKADSVSLQGKVPVEKEVVEMIKEDYFKRYQKAKNKCRKIEAAEKYRRYLSKIMSPLQYLLGYENAVGNGMHLNDQQRTEYFREAVYRIRQTDIPPEEQECIGEEEPDQIQSGDLMKLVRVTEDMENRITPSARNVLKARKIVLELRETLEDISACEDPDAVEGQRLKQWCGMIQESLERNGWYPLYDTSPELGGQEQLRSSAFNIGNAVAVRVPGIFLLEDGKYELLEGFIGITTI